MVEIEKQMPSFTLLKKRTEQKDRTSLASLAGPERTQLTIARNQATDASNKDLEQNTQRDVDQTNIGLLFQKIEKVNFFSNNSNVNGTFSLSNPLLEELKPPVEQRALIKEHVQVLVVRSVCSFGSS